MKRHWDSISSSQALAVSLAVVASVVLLVVPLYTLVNITSAGPQQISHQTLLETVGPPVLGSLLIPVTLTALPLLIHGRTRTLVSIPTTVALVVFVVIGSASIGFFYIPALAAAVAAAVSPMESHESLRARRN